VLGCSTGVSPQAFYVATTTALAGSASAGSRAMGGCYAVCTGGDVCDPATGFCVRLQPENAPFQH
jgi:hypothetical protein